MIKCTSSDNYIYTNRGGIVENAHEVHVAVVDDVGNLIFAVGDPNRITLIRSAAKPLQALAVLETGGFDKQSLKDADLSLMCASHNSEEGHLERARRMLQSVHAAESDLMCGGHASINPDLARRWIREGIEPTAIYNNCSGKHAGMLIGAEALGVPFVDYHLPDHPMQLQIKQLVEELTGLSSNEIRWGIDGCNMPAPALPLTILAKSYALFARAAVTVSQDLSPPIRDDYMSRVFNAMSKHPEQVGGVDRFCTILMEAYQGQLIGKVGADACYGIGIKASDQTRALGVKGSLGIAVKVGDGNLDILYTAVAHILEQLKIGDSNTRQSLKRYHDVKLVNSMGVETGHVSVAFKLRRVNNA